MRPIVTAIRRETLISAIDVLLEEELVLSDIRYGTTYSLIAVSCPLYRYSNPLGYSRSYRLVRNR
jgi:hypothetical protein